MHEENSLPQRIADVIVQLNGGIHTGFRFMHAKGVMVTGTFTPASGARSISTAAHLTGVPVTVRFSDGTGIPTIPDTDTRGAPRGRIAETLEGAAEACIHLAALAGSTAVLEACVRDEYELFAERIAHALAPPDGTWKIMDGTWNTNWKEVVPQACSGSNTRVLGRAWAAA
jgi:hypothetical protein